MNKKELSKGFFYGMIAISMVLIIFVGIGFGVFAAQPKPIVYQDENGGNIVINYTNKISGLKIEDVVPTVDSVAMKSSDDNEYFDFSIDLLLDNASVINYEIAAIKNKENSTISDSDVRLYLEKEKSGEYIEVLKPSPFVPLKEESKFGTKPGSMVLYSTKATKSGTEHFRLRMWLSDKSLLAKGSYEVEIVVNGISK
jgi:hypothetical protein